MGVTLQLGSGRDWREERLWYAVQTRAKSEHIAAAGLRQFPEVEVFCPRLRFQRATARGPVWFVEALFPGYLFARFAAGQHLRAVSHSQAVTRLLQFGPDFAVLPDAAVAALRAEVGRDGVREIRVAPGPGDEVELASGPLRGFTGTVTRITSGEQRVRVLLEFLGQVREVEVAAHELRSEHPPQLAFA